MRQAAWLSLIVPFLTNLAPAEDNWPNWRGPHRVGVSKSTNLPTHWSESQNIVWKTPLPSWSGASPIIWGDRIFIASPSDPDAGQAPVTRRFPRVRRSTAGGRDLLLLCINKRDGSVIWEKKLASDNQQYGKQNMSSPSPVTDGKHVWALTGTGVLTAFDMDGKKLWAHNLQEDYGDFGLQWGYASSPLLYDGKVIVEVLHGARTQNPSYLVAFDGVSGKVAWQIERKTDATRECPDAYTTPALIEHKGRVELIISGADYVTSHDPATGKELWRAAGLNPRGRGNYRVVASPVAIDGLVYCPSRKRPLLALRVGGSGDVTDSHLAWKLEERWGPDVPTPACDGKYLYIVGDNGSVACVDPKSGKIIWGPERTEIGTVSASPLLADGKLYITNENATTTVLAAGPKFEVLATNRLDDDYTISSIAVSGSQLFVRTSAHLVCIGESTP